jgi:hypothetical protein
LVIDIYSNKEKSGLNCYSLINSFYRVVLCSAANPLRPDELETFVLFVSKFVLFPSICCNWLELPAAFGPPFTVAVVDAGVEVVPVALPLLDEF